MPASDASSVRLASLSAAALLCLAGCGSGSNTTESSPNVEGAHSLFTARFALARAEPALYVVVVDDANSPEAIEVREAAMAALEFSVRKTYAAGGRGVADPAIWAPADLVVATLSASLIDGGHITDAAPPLAILRTSAGPVEDFERFIDELSSRVLEPGVAMGPHQPIATFERLYALRTEGAAAESDWERALAEAAEVRLTDLLDERLVGHRGLVAVARDDEGADPVGQFAPDQGDTVGLGWTDIAAIVPLPDAGGLDDCWALGTPQTRIGEWFTSNDIAVHASSPACGPERALQGLIDTPAGTRCLPRPALWDDGSARCLLRVGLYGEECAPEKGWIETDATWPVAADKVETVCEVKQLSGDARRACARDFDCPGCEPGWCLSEVFPWDDPDANCRADRTPAYAWRLPGAAGVGRGWLSITCATSP